MYPTQAGDRLYKVSRYELHRDDSCLFIEISHCLKGDDPGTFEATIFLNEVELSERFSGCGPTEGAALRECLLTILHLRVQQIRDLEGWSQPVADES